MFYLYRRLYMIVCSSEGASAFAALRRDKSALAEASDCKHGHFPGHEALRRDKSALAEASAVAVSGYGGQVGGTSPPSPSLRRGKRAPCSLTFCRVTVGVSCRAGAGLI